MTPPRPWVEPEDIRGVAFGLYLSDDDDEALAKLVKFAEDKILSRRGLRVAERLASGALDPDMVRGVVTDMVLRVIKNPGGVQSDSLGSSSTAYFRNAASGAVELLEEDIEILKPTPRRFGTMRVGVPGWRIP